MMLHIKIIILIYFFILNTQTHCHSNRVAPIVTIFSMLPTISNRALLGYKISRSTTENISNPNSWDNIGTTNTANDTTYTDATWAQQPSGIYTYIIQSRYSNNVLSTPAFSNTVAYDMNTNVIVNLATSNNMNPVGTVLYLTCVDGDPTHVYQMTATSSTVVFPNVWRGTYTIKASLPGYTKFVETNVQINVNPFTYSLLLTLSPFVFEDDFENYESFSTAFTPWTLIDQDHLAAYGFSGITFPHSGEDRAFIIFAPAETTPAMTDITAHSGNIMAACFASDPANNDWMISPQIHVTTNPSVSFFVRSFTASYGLERFKVYVGTSPNPATMTLVSPAPYVEAPIEWTQFTYSLNAFQNQNIYVAINCVSMDAFIFFVDDFQVSDERTNTLPVTLSSFNAMTLENNSVKIKWTTESETNMSGYHLYRSDDNNLNNAKKITTQLIPATNSSGQNNYSVNDEEVEHSHTYYYWLTSIESNGSCLQNGPVSVRTNDNIETPEIFTLNKLNQSYPNPFKTSTNISYSISGVKNTAVPTEICIYNVKGQKVKTLIIGNHLSGKDFSINWDGTNQQGQKVQTGIYFYKFSTPEYTDIKKMILIK